jgi:hypothetical protein
MHVQVKVGILREAQDCKTEQQPSERSPVSPQEWIDAYKLLAILYVRVGHEVPNPALCGFTTEHFVFVPSMHHERVSPILQLLKGNVK